MKLEYLLLPSDTTFNTSIANSTSKNLRIKKHKPNLTDAERESIYNILSKYSVKGKLPRGLLREISIRFGVKPRTISRIWHQGQKSIKLGFKSADVCSRIKFNSGRKKSCIGSIERLYQNEFSLVKSNEYNNLYIN
jgi:hypothetical protein